MSSSVESLSALKGAPGVQGLLRAIRYAEGTSAPDGYNIMFGGKRFAGNQHPDSVQRTSGYASAAAGAYQFMPDTWREVSSRLGLKDFSPGNQDVAALALAQRRGVNLDEVARWGVTPEDVFKLAPEWASFPKAPGKGSYYGQPSKPLEQILRVAGGSGSPPPPAAPVEPSMRMAGSGLLTSLPGLAMPGAGGASVVSPFATEAPQPGQAGGPAQRGTMLATAAFEGMGLGPRLAAASQAALAPAPASSGAAPMAAPVTPAALGGAWEKPSSVVYEKADGQPGVDLFFESKNFPAVLGGRVKDVRREPGYGNFVVIESPHPGGGAPVDTLYSHLADGGINVKPGEMVAPGQIIGKQGGTGNVRSADGTIASIDFLAAAPAGSNSMAPHPEFDKLRRFAAWRMGAG